MPVFLFLPQVWERQQRRGWVRRNTGGSGGATTSVSYGGGGSGHRRRRFRTPHPVMLRTGVGRANLDEAFRDSNWYHPQGPSRRSGHPPREEPLFSLSRCFVTNGNSPPFPSVLLPQFAVIVPLLVPSSQSSSGSPGFVKKARLHAQCIVRKYEGQDLSHWTGCRYFPLQSFINCTPNDF